MDPVVWPSLAFSGREAVGAVRSLCDELEAPAPSLDRLESFGLSGPSSAAEPRNGTVLFLQSAQPSDLDRLSGLRGCLMILPSGVDARGPGRENAVLFARNPKYAYARLMTALFPLSVQRGDLAGEPAPGVRAASGFVREEGVELEPFVTIGPDSTVGRGSYIMKGAVIGPRVRIGRDCVIGEGAVIGDPGFGFAFDRNRPPLRIPQLGGVVLGDRVELGSHGTVGAGTISPTVLGDGVKAGNHVHVGHNCRIGSGSFLCVGTTVSGSCRVGERCWLAPGVVVRNKVSLGDGATAGMGAVVVKDVPAGWTVAGLPAKPTGNEVPWYQSERGLP